MSWTPHDWRMHRAWQRPSLLGRHRAFLAAGIAGKRVMTRAAPLPRVLYIPRGWHLHQHTLRLNSSLIARFTNLIRQRTQTLAHTLHAHHTHRLTQTLRDRVGVERHTHTQPLERSFHTRHTLRTLSIMRPASAEVPIRTQLVRRVEQVQAYPRLSAAMAQPQPGTPKRTQSEAQPTAQPAPPALRPTQPQPTVSVGTQAWTLPLPELTRVTEHVIGQIEHRALSFRERSGQL